MGPSLNSLRGTTLLVLIFAGLNFRDFRDSKIIAKLKTREKKLSRKLTTRNLIPCYKTLLLTLTSVYMIMCPLSSSCI